MPQTSETRREGIPGDYAEIVDALLRFAAGQDDGDAALFASAFCDDAVLDFVQPAAALGATVEAFRGRDAIVGAVLGAVAPLTTSHTITNVRVLAWGEDYAETRGLIEAQHVLRRDPIRRLLLKNRIDTRLRREGEVWRISAMTFEPLWREGDPTVLFP